MGKEILFCLLLTVSLFTVFFAEAQQYIGCWQSMVVKIPIA